MNSRVVGIFGNSASDEYVETRAVVRNEGSVDITFLDGSVQSFPVKSAG